MTQVQVQEIVNEYLLQSLNGASIENPKLDFKKKWYDLTLDDGKADFLIDTSALANTFGLDGFIVIGFDDDKKEFIKSNLADSGFKGSPELMNFISKQVDPIYTLNYYPITFQEHSLCVLHVPPSINKPHVIRSYTKNKKYDEHRIFVRKSSQNHRATRHDIELMYYDRKNVVPEFYLESSCHKGVIIGISINHQANDQYQVRCTWVIDIENLGRRPVSIVDVELELSIDENPREKDILKVNTADWYHREPIVIPVNTLRSIELRFTNHISSFGLNQCQRVVDSLINPYNDIRFTNMTCKTSSGQLLKIPFKISS